ncbi:protein of unknown function (4846) [Halpernia humi]|uniref:DUF4846 domain-containing protein n=1 Tax=Halpernia humi TaxID=493375 RepID=A0A1H5WY40_9FLAO|nr:DUF4846 domain-containing protein [Halpernia humi]SEG03927.1 protein of unknown function (4846) [Halpernia humi]
MKNLRLLLLFLIFINCNKKESNSVSNISKSSQIKETSEVKNLINKNGLTIKDRFFPPENFKLNTEKEGSFGAFIENFKLKPYGSKILKYDGAPISTQNLHEAIFDIDTGTKDLQQCADAVIRLRAEYLYKTKQFNDIKFHFTNGDLMTWNDYKNGARAFVNGNKVSFKTTEKFDDSYQNFRKYLDLIFNYAGTISLNKETFPVLKTSSLKTGDILITAGSPGHVVFIAAVAENDKKEKLFLLGEGYTPAQSIHIVKNSFQPEISPWYKLDTKNTETETARYLFKPTNFRSF